MQKTLTFTITLDEIEAGKAAEVLAGAGLTPEGVIRQLLERTAREGVVPLRKGRARPKRTDGGDAGAHFVQGDLFARPDPAEPFYSFNPPAAKPETLLPSLVTLRALQDAQAKLRWRERERESADGSMLQSGPDAPLELLETKQFRFDKSLIVGDPELLVFELLETKQFRFDKSLIVGDPRRSAIIAALEALFTELTNRRVPEGLRPVGNGDSLYAVLDVERAPLGLILQIGGAEICLVRYGTPESLLENPHVLEH